MLRPYQAEAVAKTYDYLRRQADNPCIVIPTAGGKTHVIAQFCRDAIEQYNARVLIATHVKELIEQNYNKLLNDAPDLAPLVGLYSAGLKQKDGRKAIVIGGVQSLYRSIDALGHRDVLIVDEAHLIPADGEGMYQTLIAGLRNVNPNMRIIGLTATPYRLSTGMLCKSDGILNAVSYEVSVKRLILDGYLCSLTSKAGRRKADLSGVRIERGEFKAPDLQAAMTAGDNTTVAVNEMLAFTKDRRAVLVFCAGIEHANAIADLIRPHGTVETIFGETLTPIRDRAIEDFRAGKIKYLVNVNVLTTGFDAPHLDCVVMLRPTMSAGLYYQMVGRGFRLSPGKTDCLILDYGGNIVRHGPIDEIQIEEKEKREKGEPAAKECPQCAALISLGYKTCPQCGYVFPPPERKEPDASATDAAILSQPAKIEEYNVSEVEYSEHEKRNDPDAPHTMRVTYHTGSFSEWVCFNHVGYARAKAENWWRVHGGQQPPPASVAEALSRTSELLTVCRIRVKLRRHKGEYDQIIGVEMGAPGELPIPTAEEDLPF